VRIAAVAASAGAIVTENGSDFTAAALRIFEPAELLAAVLASAEE
jgi:hypothetical protein